MRRDRGRVLRWAARTRRRHQAAALVLRTAAPVLPRGRRPRAPVFVIGAPRSGTTVLFDLLDRSPALASLGVESHILWDAFHPGGAGSDHAVPASAAGARERRALDWAIRRIAGESVYLDKYPRLCLRVPYLAALYPDARFVHVVRDGRAVTSSLITGWTAHGRFGLGTRVDVPLRIAGYDGDVWRFLLPPGWRSYAQGSTLAEVCAFQWSAANRAVLDARGGIAPDRWTEVRYEQLVADPTGTMTSLLDRLALPHEPVLTAAAALSTTVSRTAVTPPRPDKWRDEHPREIASVTAELEPMMARLGYA